MNNLINDIISKGFRINLIVAPDNSLIGVHIIGPKSNWGSYGYGKTLEEAILWSMTNIVWTMEK